jgi:hypothetical protein
LIIFCGAVHGRGPLVVPSSPVSLDHEMNGMIVGEQGDNRELFRPWLAGE